MARLARTSPETNRETLVVLYHTTDGATDGPNWNVDDN